MIKKSCSLIKPLSEDDIFNFTCDYRISDKVKSFTQTLYKTSEGCFLVGGFRGTGKTTFVNLCCHNVSKRDIGPKIIPIYVNMGNQKKGFISTLIRHVYRYVLDSDLKGTLIEEQLNELMDLYNRTFAKMTETFTITDKDSVSCERMELKQESSSFGFALPKVPILLGGLDTKRQISDNKKDSNSKEVKFQIDYSAIYDEEIELIRFQYLLENISENKKVRLIFVLDELDKLETDSFIKLFDKHKQLFFESGAVFIFITGYDSYLKIAGAGRDQIDGYSQYFIGTYYIPLLDWEAFQIFFYRYLGTNRLLDAMDIYYKSSGLIRSAIAQKEIVHGNTAMNRVDSVGLCDLFINVMNSYDIQVMPDDIRDVLKVKLKGFLDLILTLKKVPIKEIYNAFDIQSNNIIHGYQLYADVLISIVIKICSNKKKSYIIKLEYPDCYSEEKFFLINKDADYKNYFALDATIEYPKWEREYTTYGKRIIFDYHYIELKSVTDLLAIIESSLKDVVVLITTKKKIEFFGTEANELSATAVILEEAGEVLYYVQGRNIERFEGQCQWDGFIDKVRGFGVKVFSDETKTDSLKDDFDRLLRVIDDKLF